MSHFSVIVGRGILLNLLSQLSNVWIIVDGAVMHCFCSNHLWFLSALSCFFPRIFLQQFCSQKDYLNYFYNPHLCVVLFESCWWPNKKLLHKLPQCCGSCSYLQSSVCFFAEGITKPFPNTSGIWIELLLLLFTLHYIHALLQYFLGILVLDKCLE